MIDRVFLIDDDESFLRSMERRLFAYGLQVQSFRSAEDFLSQVPLDCEGCILLDVHMPGMTGFDLQDQLNAARSCLPVIFISGMGDIPKTVKAMKNGAESFLTKVIDTRTLLETINKALLRCRNNRKKQGELAKKRQQILQLSLRELQVFAALLKGWSNRQIAEHLQLAERTVKYHRTMLSRRYGINSPVEMMKIIMEAEISESDLEEWISNRDSNRNPEQ